jgi:large subunit ribosomal protein L10e
MAVRKALAYSKMHTRPYTRKSTKKSKSYIKTVPPQKIAKRIMGDQKTFEAGGFKYVLKLVVCQNVLIRDIALEASRQYLNKVLDADLTGEYYLELKVYPHHILRENKTGGGVAGADRVSTGMTQSFGTTIGRAAIVKKDKEIFIIGVNTEKAMGMAIAYLKQIRPKIPGKCAINVKINKK